MHAAHASTSTQQTQNGRPRRRLLGVRKERNIHFVSQVFAAIEEANQVECVCSVLCVVQLHSVCEQQFDGEIIPITITVRCWLASDFS